MAFNYNQRQYQQIPDKYNLKPVNYAQTNILGGYEGAELERLSTQDGTLKHRIRILRIISRVLATIMSAATLAPLTMTLIKFFQTRNQVLVVDGEDRTAWAARTQAWYMYVYFGISAISFILNAAILLSYCWGVKKANRASSVSGWWSGIIIVGHIVVWAASVAIYRYGKVPKDGRFTDLWGWTCSTAADAIQSQVPNIDYSKYCTIQSASFYAGIVHVFTSLLSAGIYLMVFLRMRSKKRVLEAEARLSQSQEPYRH